MNKFIKKYINKQINYKEILQESYRLIVQTNVLNSKKTYTYKKTNKK